MLIFFIAIVAVSTVTETSTLKLDPKLVRRVCNNMVTKHKQSNCYVEAYYSNCPTECDEYSKRKGNIFRDFDCPFGDYKCPVRITDENCYKYCKKPKKLGDENFLKGRLCCGSCLASKCKEAPKTALGDRNMCKYKRIYIPGSKKCPKP